MLKIESYNHYILNYIQMDNHYDEIEDDQLIDLDYIGNRNQDEPHMLDEHRPNLSSKSCPTTSAPTLVWPSLANISSASILMHWSIRLFRFAQHQAVLVVGGSPVLGGTAGGAIGLPAGLFPIIGVVARIVPVVATGVAGHLVEHDPEQRGLEALKNLLGPEDHALRISAVLNQEHGAIDRACEDARIAHPDDRRGIKDDLVVPSAQRRDQVLEPVAVHEAEREIPSSAARDEIEPGGDRRLDDLVAGSKRTPRSCSKAADWG